MSFGIVHVVRHHAEIADTFVHCSGNAVLKSGFPISKVFVKEALIYGVSDME